METKIMKEVCLALIGQLNSSVLVLLLILVAVGISLYKIGKWTAQIGQINEQVKEVGNNKDRLVKLEGKVDLIYLNTMRTPLIQSHSPMSLTQIGNDVASSIDATQILNKYYPDLKKMVEGETPKTAYDIQEVSMKVARESMEALLNETELVGIKDEAFKRGLLVEDIMSVFGILLRNRILEDKKIPIAEVDRTQR